jgi:hypothetical protein
LRCSGDDDGYQQTDEPQCPQGRCEEAQPDQKTIMGDATIWTKRDKTSGELRAIKKTTKNDGKESRAEEIAAAKKKAAKQTTVAKSSRVSSREKVRRCSLCPTFSAL